ncbi:uncharacterized protein LOC125812767 [Solanum verrucosum]|uniref:uncharacterized protein LOC125812767 n=1 Tax=Solanum verrucosum TaxID=315347 RepID=UPI0020D1C51F|nr:uncharacterized protein LOC125812767 [Solanum verrucosum]
MVWPMICRLGCDPGRLPLRQVGNPTDPPMVEVCKTSNPSSADVTALKTAITGFLHDVDELKSTNILMLWGNVYVPDDPSADMSAISEIPPAIVTRHAVTVDDDRESDTLETDEEQLEARDEVVFEDIKDL